MKIPYNARSLLADDHRFNTMRPVEVLVIGRDSPPAPLEFRSIRTAYQYVEDNLEHSKESMYMIHSRVHVSNKLTKDWLLVAADAHQIKHFLIRIKP